MNLFVFQYMNFSIRLLRLKVFYSDWCIYRNAAFVVQYLELHSELEWKYEIIFYGQNNPLTKGVLVEVLTPPKFPSILIDPTFRLKLRKFRHLYESY